MSEQESRPYKRFIWLDTSSARCEVLRNICCTSDIVVTLITVS